MGDHASLDVLPPTPTYRRLDRTYCRCPHCDREVLLPPDDPLLLSAEFVESFPCSHCDRLIYLMPVSMERWIAEHDQVATRAPTEAADRKHIRERLALRVQPLRVTPAIATGVTTRLWEVSDLVALLEAAESKKAA